MIQCLCKNPTYYLYLITYKELKVVPYGILDASLTFIGMEIRHVNWYEQNNKNEKQVPTVKFDDKSDQDDIKLLKEDEDIEKPYQTTLENMQDSDVIYKFIESITCAMNGLLIMVSGSNWTTGNVCVTY